jgi:hypothetical protein
MFIKDLFYSTILIGYENTSIQDKTLYASKVVITFSPLAYLLSGFNTWFADNSQFFVGILYALFANVVIGGWYHYKAGSFKWRLFFYKNIEMWIIILLTYPLLEVMNYIVKEYAIGELFKIVIQLATLLYPISKILKNIYILSNRQFPPAFIMERIYNFKKTGDLEFLIHGRKDNDQHDTPPEKDFPE